MLPKLSDNSWIVAGVLGIVAFVLWGMNGAAPYSI